MRGLRKFMVVSSQMERAEPVLDGTGPTEVFFYACEVEACTKREARTKGVGHPDMREWVQSQRDDGMKPYVRRGIRHGFGRWLKCCIPGMLVGALIRLAIDIDSSGPLPWLAWSIGLFCMLLFAVLVSIAVEER